MLKSPTGASSDSIRKTMRANRDKNTAPEVSLRRHLWAAGLRGYRLHVKKLPGKPDIVFTKKRLAVFVHGCWWHGCQMCGRYRLPKTNSDYWRQKLELNRQRDAIAQAALERIGFRVFVAWECEIQRFPIDVVGKIVDTLQ